MGPLLSFHTVSMLRVSTPLRPRRNCCWQWLHKRCWSTPPNKCNHYGITQAQAHTLEKKSFGTLQRLLWSSILILIHLETHNLTMMQPRVCMFLDRHNPDLQNTGLELDIPACEFIYMGLPKVSRLWPTRKRPLGWHIAWLFEEVPGSVYSHWVISVFGQSAFLSQLFPMSSSRHWPPWMCTSSRMAESRRHTKVTSRSRSTECRKGRCGEMSLVHIGPHPHDPCRNNALNSWFCRGTKIARKVKEAEHCDSEGTGRKHMIFPQEEGSPTEKITLPSAKTGIPTICFNKWTV